LYPGVWRNVGEGSAVVTIVQKEELPTERRGSRAAAEKW
jgi:hypothetical protein